MKTKVISLNEYEALLETVPNTDPNKTIAGIWHSTIQHPELGET